MTAQQLKNRIRIRVCGILKIDKKLLLVQLHSPVSDQLVWMPPGGGLQFGESMKQCLQREFLEETGFQIEVGPLAFTNELVQPPFHAVEFYFKVQQTGGKLKLGADPERSPRDQLLNDLQWIPLDELNNIPLAPKPLSAWIKKADSKKED